MNEAIEALEKELDKAKEVARRAHADFFDAGKALGRARENFNNAELADSEATKKVALLEEALSMLKVHV